MDRRYRPLHPLEYGEDVSTYLVEDTWFMAQRVLTLLPAFYSDRARRRDTFRVLDIRRQLNGVLVPVLDVGWRGNQLGVVTNPIQAEPLPGTIAQNPSLERRYSLALDITRTVAAAESRGLYFGCLTPSQFYVDGSSRAIANLIVPAPPGHPAGHSRSSVRYAAPEVLRGDAAHAGSDVYALGMLLYYLFTGREPYADDRIDCLVAKQSIAFPARPKETNPDLPFWLDQLIMEMIAKDADSRPVSASWVCSLIEQSLPVQASLVAQPALYPLVDREDEIGACFNRLDRIQNSTPGSVLLFQGAGGFGKSTLLEQIAWACKIWKIPFLVSPAALANRLRIPGATALVPDMAKTIERPAVLLVDDLDAADSDTLGVVCEASQSQGILVVATCARLSRLRNWEQPFGSVLDSLCCEQRSLAPFTEEHVAQFLVGVFGHQIPAKLARTIWENSNGRPSRMVKYLEYLRSTSALVFRDGRWRLGFEPSGSPPVWAEVRELAEGLDWACLPLLACLSLLTDPADASLLARLLAVPEADLHELLRELQLQGIVKTLGSIDTPAFALADRPLGDAIIDRLGRVRAEELHRRIAEVFEEPLDGGPDPGRLPNLVWHSLQAGDLVKAKKHFPDCLAHLERSGNYASALPLLEAARQARMLPAWHQDVNLRAVNLLSAANEGASVIELCRELLGSCELVPQVRSRVLGMLARQVSAHGQSLEAVRLFEEALSISGDPPPLDLQADLLCCLVQGNMRGKADSLACELTRHVEAETGGSPNAGHSVYRALYLYYRAFHRRPANAVNWLIRSAADALDRGHQAAYLLSLRDLAVHQLTVGYFSQAVRIAEELGAQADKIANRGLRAEANLVKATVLRKRGEHQGALTVLHSLLDDFQESGPNRSLEIQAHLEMARNLNAMLLPWEALVSVDRARTLIEEYDDLPLAVPERLTRARTYLTLGEPAGALRLLESNWPTPPVYAAQTAFARACAVSAVGRHSEAVDELNRALGLTPRYMVYHRCRLGLYKSRSLLSCGHVEAAEETAVAARRIALQHDFLLLQAFSRIVLGNAKLVRGESRKAEVDGRRALQLLQGSENRQILLEAQELMLHSSVAMKDPVKEARYREDAWKCAGESLSRTPRDKRDAIFNRWQCLSAASVPGSSRSAPALMVRLRNLSELLRPGLSRFQIVSRILRVLRSDFREASVGIHYETRSDLGSSPISRGYHPDGSAWCPTGLGRFPARPERERCNGVTTIRIPVFAGDHAAGYIAVRGQRLLISELQFDFLTCISRMLAKEMEAAPTQRQKPKSEKKAVSVYGAVTIVGQHPALLELLGQLERVAVAEGTVLLTGESGTGKEVIARALHHVSPRRAGPFIAINCSSIPSELIENELFGHSKGSFTGALDSKPGLIEAASGGTLFLDEIESMPLPLQARLLRFLQDRAFRRLGETTERIADLRVVAATNRSLEELVLRKEFRQDLYHRLNVHHLSIPALRDRVSDIPLLAGYFLDLINERSGSRKTLSPDALTALSAYPFPGNVRELRNLIESAFHQAEGHVIESRHIPRRCLQTADRTVSVRRLATLMANLRSGPIDFWAEVREPFLRRDLSREEVKQIVEFGLSLTGGSYRRLLDHFGLSSEEYKRFLSFLDAHDCKLDFRRFRAKAGS